MTPRPVAAGSLPTLSTRWLRRDRYRAVHAGMHRAFVRVRAGLRELHFPRGAGQKLSVAQAGCIRALERDRVRGGARGRPLNHLTDVRRLRRGRE